MVAKQMKQFKLLRVKEMRFRIYIRVIEHLTSMGKA